MMLDFSRKAQRRPQTETIRHAWRTVYGLARNHLPEGPGVSAEQVADWLTQQHGISAFLKADLTQGLAHALGPPTLGLHNRLYRRPFYVRYRYMLREGIEPYPGWVKHSRADWWTYDPFLNRLYPAYEGAYTLNSPFSGFKWW